MAGRKPRTCTLRTGGAVLLSSLLLQHAPLRAAVPPAHDARFQQSYARTYEALKGVAPDMVVMELRDRVELIASRGSQVGAASTSARVRGFESALVQGLQNAICRSAPAKAARPWPVVVERIGAAADAQHLRAQSDDIAELTALTQRLLDSQPRERWCGIKSLDDIR